MIRTLWFFQLGHRDLRRQCIGSETCHHLKVSCSSYQSIVSFSFYLLFEKAFICWIQCRLLLRRNMVHMDVMLVKMVALLLISLCLIMFWFLLQVRMTTICPKNSHFTWNRDQKYYENLNMHQICKNKLFKTKIETKKIQLYSVTSYSKEECNWIPPTQP